MSRVALKLASLAAPTAATMALPAAAQDLRRNQSCTPFADKRNVAKRLCRESRTVHSTAFRNDVGTLSSSAVARFVARVSTAGTVATARWRFDKRLFGILCWSWPPGPDHGQRPHSRPPCPRPFAVRIVDSRAPLVLDAAARLFCRQGYEGTSIRDINARGWDAARLAVHCHFATRKTC